MSTNRTQRHQAVGALSWYGSQVRLVAAKIIRSIRRTAHALLDDPDSSLIELATTREDIRVGDAGNGPVLRSGVGWTANDEQPDTVTVLPDTATERSGTATGADPPVAAVEITAQGLQRVGAP